MKIKLEVKDIYGQIVKGEFYSTILFNIVRNPDTRENLHYRIFVGDTYREVKKDQYYKLKEFIDRENDMEAEELISYLFRGKLQNVKVKDAGREVFIGKDNLSNLCTKVILKDTVEQYYIFEDREGDILLKEEDYPTIEKILREYELELFPDYEDIDEDYGNSENLYIGEENEDNEDNEKIELAKGTKEELDYLKKQIENTKESLDTKISKLEDEPDMDSLIASEEVEVDEVDEESPTEKQSLADFINNLKAENLTKAIKRKK